MVQITTEDFRNYRFQLGFPNQTTAKEFFGAKDIRSDIDFGYLDHLNERLGEMIVRVNQALSDGISLADEELGDFKRQNIDTAFATIRDNNILPRLNNQGRRPEEVYFSWMRGHLMSKLFQKAIGVIFNIDPETISSIGDDDLGSVETFKRTPKADLEVDLPTRNKMRIEMQSGFTGINDIKQHKILEAKKQTVGTLAIHVDLFNGQVAFVRLDRIEDGDANWVTRTQMEGQVVLSIDQNYFVWKLTDMPPTYAQLAEWGIL